MESGYLPKKALLLALNLGSYSKAWLKTSIKLSIKSKNDSFNYLTSQLLKYKHTINDSLHKKIWKFSSKSVFNNINIVII